MNALILFNYGSLHSLDDVTPFYKHVLHGHVTEEFLEKGYELFRSLGTADPLTSISRRAGREIAAILERNTGEQFKVYFGNKHSAPLIKEATAQAVADNAKEIMTLTLSPLHSKTGVRVYEQSVRNTLRKLNAEHIPLTHVSGYYDDERFMNVMVDRLRTAIRWFPQSIRQQSEIFFTVHSMPGTAETHQEFIAQYEYLATNLIEMAGWKGPYHLAYRSGGPSDQKWLGPDILTAVMDASVRKKRGIISCELLSITRNAEVIQEVGREAQQLAHSLGMDFVQTEYLDDSTDFINMLGELAVEKFKGVTGTQTKNKE